MINMNDRCYCPRIAKTLFSLCMFLLTIILAGPALAEEGKNKDGFSGQMPDMLAPYNIQFGQQETRSDRVPKIEADKERAEEPVPGLSEKNTAEQSRSLAEKYFSRPSPLLGENFSRPVREKDSKPEEEIYNIGLKVPEVDRDLEQYGYDFFTTRMGDVASKQTTPVGPDYIVGPGDSFIVSLWGSLEGQYELVVNRDGEIVIPRVGSIVVWGQTLEEAKKTIRRQISNYFTGFDMDVTLGALRSIQVYLVGEVKSPGTYTISSLSTILTALVEAGGPIKTGSLRHVQLMRNGQLIETVDFYDFLLNGDKSRDRRLQSGDTVFVPVIGPLVGVAGDVRRPAIYELKGDEVLKDVLRMAGGVSSTAYLGKVEIERIEAHRKRTVLDIDLAADDALNLKLHDKDLVKVSSISPLAERYVSLSGYVARPGKYHLVPGMRVADLILPHENLLPFYYPEMAEVLRMTPPEFRPEKITFDLRKALSGDPEHNIALQQFDEVRLYSLEQMEEIPEVDITGAILNPGTYRLFDKMKVRDLVISAGNLSRDAYLEEAELTRFRVEERSVRTERILIDLQKVMQDDPAHNIALQPDDHLVVRALPEFAKKMIVEVSGKVVFPGTYTISRGENLSSVLQRAGGFADGAYLRGAVFTRESVRESVQSRIQKLIMQEESKIIRVSSEIAQGAMGEQDVSAARSLLESRKEMLDRLKSVPVVGRMIIHLEPLDRFRGSNYDIELMDGDKIMIPENPHSVSVLGEVYNPTSLTYAVGEPVSFYLDKVGGPNQDANEEEMFIVRADGSVYSRQQSGWGFTWDDFNNRWVSGGFAGTELYPGDTILVPQKFRHVDVMREVKDITTILYQMALGAAAVASF